MKPEIAQEDKKTTRRVTVRAGRSQSTAGQLVQPDTAQTWLKPKISTTCPYPEQPGSELCAKQLNHHRLQ